MIESYIKYFFMFICILWIYRRLINAENKKVRYILDIGASFLLSGIIYFVRSGFPYAVIFTIFVLVALYSVVNYDLVLKINIIVSLMSIVLSYLLFFIASSVVSVLLGVIVYIANIKYIYIYHVLVFIVGIVQLVLCKLLFCMASFRRGMPFILGKVSNSLGVAIGCVACFLTSFFTVRHARDIINYIEIFAFAMLALILVIWWKKQFKVSYILNQSRSELLSLELEVKKLKQDNEALKAVIHKDNKLIPAMERCVREVLDDCAMPTKNVDADKVLRLADELKKLAGEREGILDASAKQVATLPATGITRLDAILMYMHDSAKSKGVNFDISIDVNVQEMIKKTVSENTLITLVADLVENAIIATKASDMKNVRLSIGRENNHYHISIYDSGIPFEPYTIVNAGKIKATTHELDGGSGIGLMTTFAFLRENLATFMIDETVERTANIAGKKYTKKVAVLFDYKNQYIINSNREEIMELRKNNQRILVNSPIMA